MKQNIIETVTLRRNRFCSKAIQTKTIQYNNQNYSININLAMHDWHFVSCGIEHCMKIVLHCS